MAYDQTTEWEDIQVKLGNFIPTKEKHDYYKEELDNIYKVLDDKGNNNYKTKEEQMNNNDNKDDSFDFDIDDDEYFQNLKSNKLNDFKKYDSNIIKSKSELYSSFLDKQIPEVKDKLLMVYLYNDKIPQSNLVFKLIIDNLNLIKKENYNNSNIALYKMEAKLCVENFKDEDIPGIVFYFNGKFLYNITKMNESLFIIENLNQSKFLEHVKYFIKKYIDLKIYEKSSSSQINNDEEFLNKNKPNGNISSSNNDSNYIKKNDREYFWEK